MDTSSFQVKVTNKNDFPIKDMFDGIPYTFGAGETVNVPYDAACHIFGVPFAADGQAHSLENLRPQIFLHLVKRWGWNRAEVIKDKLNEVWFKNIEFKLIALTLVEQTVDEDKAPLPEPREQQLPAPFKNKGGRPAKKSQEEDDAEAG